MKMQRAEAMNQRIHSFAEGVGTLLVDGFHYLALFAIGGVTVWSAVYCQVSPTLSSPSWLVSPALKPPTMTGARSLTDGSLTVG